MNKIIDGTAKSVSLKAVVGMAGYSGWGYGQFIAGSVNDSTYSKIKFTDSLSYLHI